MSPFFQDAVQKTQQKNHLPLCQSLFDCSFASGHVKFCLWNSKRHEKLSIKLGGGFKYVLFSSLFGGKWSNLTNIFQMGWNHQLVRHFWNYGAIFETPHCCKGNPPQVHGKEMIRFGFPPFFPLAPKLVKTSVCFSLLTYHTFFSLEKNPLLFTCGKGRIPRKSPLQMQFSFRMCQLASIDSGPYEDQCR